MIVHAPVSVGELIDKITILEIKQANIIDQKKLENVNTELAMLRSVVEDLGVNCSQAQKELKTVNLRLWKIEDDIRAKEAAKQFDDDFIELARSVYITNDIRAKIKRQINDLVGSDLVEEKCY